MHPTRQRHADERDPQLVGGRARIAHELERSEPQVTRYAQEGLLPVLKARGRTSILRCRRIDLERVKAQLNSEIEG